MVFENGKSSFLLELISHAQNSSSIKNSLLLISLEFQAQRADLLYSKTQIKHKFS